MSNTSTASSIDPARYREVMRLYPTGVVVVTGALTDGAPIGMVVGTFTSLSMDPPLVAFMPTRESVTYAALRTTPTYCINLLAHDQHHLCQVLSTRDPNKFDQVAWTYSDYGVPMLSEAVAHIHCRAANEIEVGDHLIVVCEVIAMDVARPVTPLLFCQGGYGGFAPAA